MRFFWVMLILITILVAFFVVEVKEAGNTDLEGLQGNLSTITESTNNLLTNSTLAYVDPFTTNLTVEQSVKNILHAGVYSFFKVTYTFIAGTANIAWKYATKEMMNIFFKLVMLLFSIRIFIWSVRPILMIYTVLQDYFIEKKSPRQTWWLLLISTIILLLFCGVATLLFFTIFVW